MHRPHRNLDRKSSEESEEYKNLFGQSQLQVMQIENRKTAALVIHVDQCHQHQYRTDEGIEEELQRRIDTIRTTPDTDNQEHRNQHRFEEDIEHDRI